MLDSFVMSIIEFPNVYLRHAVLFVFITFSPCTIKCIRGFPGKDKKFLEEVFFNSHNYFTGIAFYIIFILFYWGNEYHILTVFLILNFLNVSYIEAWKDSSKNR